MVCCLVWTEKKTLQFIGLKDSLGSMYTSDKDRSDCASFFYFQLHLTKSFQKQQNLILCDYYYLFYLIFCLKS